MKTRLLLVSEEGSARDAYVTVLRELGVVVDSIATPDDMTDALIDEQYSGVLVDVPTMIRCQSTDKNRITRIMDRFPVLKLMFDPDHGGVRGLAHGGTIKDNRDLSEFVLHECVPFQPRSIRVAERKEIVFNVLLLDDIARGELQGERTVTINVSEHGCFVYTVNDWPMLSPAWMVVNEFEDKTPIQLRVRWQGCWGNTMRLPGIGTSFESMTAHQYVQLHSYL